MRSQDLERAGLSSRTAVDAGLKELKRIMAGLDMRRVKRAAFAYRRASQAIADASRGGTVELRRAVEAVRDLKSWSGGSPDLSAFKISGRVMNAARAGRPNPLRADPSRTAGERRAFVADLRRRFAGVKKALRELIVREDAFGLVTTNTRWKFYSSAEQLRAFRKWLAAQMKVHGLLFDHDEDEWWRRYIEQTYRKGAGRAFDDANAAWKRRAGSKGRLDFYEGTREQFLRSSFNRPAAVAKVKTLAARTYTDLKGLSDEMATRTARVLVDGMIAGKHPREIAKELERQLDVSEKRAETIARTEVIRAHAEGQLEALGALGIEEVGVAVEWSTAGDDRVCNLCEPMEGVVLSLDEARKAPIPRHPQCRCAWLPANVGEEPAGKTTRRAIEAAIERSSERGDDGWADEVKIKSRRPKSIFNQASGDARFDRVLRNAAEGAKAWELLGNVFCPTGEGGGVDPTCSPAVGSSAADVLAAKAGDREAMERVVEQNQGLVRKLARKYAKGDAALRDDLISEGNLGLIRAIEKFDESKGVKFVTYAHQWISGMQRNEVRRQGKGRARAGELKQDLEDTSGGTHAADEARARVRESLRSLDARSADILSASYGLGGGEAQTHREIAARLGITPARVGQIEKAALAKLRELEPVAANLLANVFCPTGPGGGVDPTCSPTSGKDKAAKEIHEKANSISFSDMVQRGSIDREDTDDIERNLSVAEARKLEKYLEERVTYYMDQFEPDIDRNAVVEYVADQNTVAVEMDKLIKKYGGDRASELLEEAENWFLESNANGADAVDELRNRLNGLDYGVPEHLDAALQSYRDDIDKRVDEAVEEEESILREEHRDSVKRGDAIAEDRVRWLRNFYDSHAEQFQDLPEKTWVLNKNGNRVLRFTTSSGAEYNIFASPHGHYTGRPIVEIGFSDKEGSFGITGAGGAHEVFSNVIAATVAYVKKYDPDVITFTAAERSRRRLYDRVVKTVAAVMPDYFAGYSDNRDRGRSRRYLIAKRKVKDDVIALARAEDPEFGVLVNLESGIAAEYFDRRRSV